MLDMRRILAVLVMLATPLSLRAQSGVGGGGQSNVSGSGGGTSSPSSLTTFFNGFMGLAPDDCGNAGCTTPVTPAIRGVKFCYDGQVSGQPTTTFTSNSPAKTLTSTSLTSNIATYVLTNTNPTITTGQTVTVTGSTHNAVFNVTNATVTSANSTSFTVAITNANIGSAADAGTVNTGTIGCANFVAADVGSVIEIKGASGGAGVCSCSFTISAVTNAKTITLNTNVTSNLTSVKFWYGTDATTPLQNWATAISNGIPTATGLQTHAGYLTKFYATTQTVRIVNPLTNLDLAGSGAGYATPEPFTNLNAAESMSIWGSGPYRAGILGLSTMNWSLPSTSVNNALFFYQGWNGPNPQNFAVFSPDSTIAFNTTANTGVVCGMMSDNNAHVYTNGIQVENFHNTTGTLPGDCITDAAFESSYNNSQVYNNDFGGYYGAGANGTPGNAGGFDHVNFIGYSWLGALDTAAGPGTCNGQVIFDAASSTPFSQVRISHSKINDNGGGGANTSAVCFTGTVKGNNFPNDDNFIVDNTDTVSATSSNFGWTFKTGSAVRISFTNSRIRNSVGGAGIFLIVDLVPGSNEINMYGGSLDCGTTCVNGFQAGSSSLPSYLYGVKNPSGNVGFSTGFAFSILPVAGTAGGWNGKGILQSTSYLANQGTACTNGELALSAGWQSTGSATVTAAAGTGQTCSWTITTGTTTAANPTVTDTLTNALPAATTVCWMTVNGGTHTPVVGAGTSDTFRQTTLSATAPIFTYQETPTAGGTTYFVTRTCGP